MLALRQGARRIPLLCANSSRTAAKSFAPRLAPTAARRNYASGSGHAPKGSDVPWIAGAAVATVVGVWWGLTPSPSDGHHGDDHGDEHDSHDKHEEKEEEPKEEEKPAEDEKAEAKTDDDAGNSKSDEAEDKGEGEDKDDKKEEPKGDKKAKAGDADKPKESKPDSKK